MKLRSIPLKWEIAAILLIKLVAVIALRTFYFDNPQENTPNDWLQTEPLPSQPSAIQAPRHEDQP